MDKMDWWAVALIVPVLWVYYVCRWQFLFVIEADNRSSLGNCATTTEIEIGR